MKQISFLFTQEAVIHGCPFPLEFRFFDKSRINDLPNRTNCSTSEDFQKAKVPIKRHSALSVFSLSGVAREFQKPTVFFSSSIQMALFLVVQRHATTK